MPRVTATSLGNVIHNRPFYHLLLLKLFHHTSSLVAYKRQSTKEWQYGIRGTGHKMSIGSNSGCSGGQESGWTLYLGESSASAIRTQRRSRFSGRVGEEQDQEEDEEENLSMVSDASSGPPQCKSDDSCNNENEYDCSPSLSATDSRTRNEEKKKQKEKCARGNSGGKRSTASSVSVSDSADTDV